MTREEAIINLKLSQNRIGGIKKEEWVALQMAIEALSDTTNKDVMDMEHAIEWCKDCQHNEVCRYYPYDGCQFKDTSERPKGEWIIRDDMPSLDNTYPIACSECGQMMFGHYNAENPNFCCNCGADMR